MSEKSMNKTEFAKFILKKQYSITRGEAIYSQTDVTDALSKIIGFGSFSVSDINTTGI